MLTSSAVIDDLFRDFETAEADFPSGLRTVVNVCDVVKREEGADFRKLVSRMQEVLTRQILNKLTEEAEGIEWDVIDEGESTRFWFNYDNGCLFVSRKVNPRYSCNPFGRGYTEIDFHGVVEGIPLVGEVKAGKYTTSKTSMHIGPMSRKVRAVADVFHRPSAYIAIIPKGQRKSPSRNPRSPHEQDRFLGRGAYLVEFPYSREEFQGIVSEIAKANSLPLDLDTVPARLRPRKTSSRRPYLVRQPRFA